ncbi:MAG: ABC transporter ATP-binding protein [Clostridium sp.]|uniref:ABC transporter ATP-binding protein n=1 Tax=Clostridium sp. TaxID=1506 RepID=UPI003EE4E502
MSKLILKNIIKTYGQGDTKCEALKNVNLIINDGDFISLMGTSGSGKSTLLNILGFIDKQTSGTYYLNGEDCSTKTFNELAKIRNKNISFILQNFSLIKDLTVKENIYLPLEYRKKTKINDTDIIKITKDLNINSLLKKKVKLLSGGQQQRVAIARALIQETDIILADEPTGSLDETNSKIIMNILTELNKEGKTIIIVTHDKNIANYCTRHLIITDGVVNESLK